MSHEQHQADALHTAQVQIKRARVQIIAGVVISIVGLSAIGWYMTADEPQPQPPATEVAVRPANLMTVDAALAITKGAHAIDYDLEVKDGLVYGGNYFADGSWSKLEAERLRNRVAIGGKLTQSVMDGGTPKFTYDNGYVVEYGLGDNNAIVSMQVTSPDYGKMDRAAFDHVGPGR